MTWTITLDWPDRRICDDSGQPIHPKRGDRQTFTMEGTIASYSYNVAIAKTIPNKYLHRQRTNQRAILLVGTSTEALPHNRSLLMFWDDIRVTLTIEDQPIIWHLTNPSMQMIDQHDGRVVISIHGTKISEDREIRTTAYPAVFCMRCGSREKPGLAIQGVKNDVIVLCDDCRTELSEATKQSAQEGRVVQI